MTYPLRLRNRVELVEDDSRIKRSEKYSLLPFHRRIKTTEDKRPIGNPG